MICMMSMIIPFEDEEDEEDEEDDEPVMLRVRQKGV